MGEGIGIRSQLWVVMECSLGSSSSQGHGELGGELQESVAKGNPTEDGGGRTVRARGIKDTTRT